MSIVPFFYQHFHDLSGKLAAAGRMHVFIAGSEIHKPIWSNVSMSVSRDNPMTLDGNGVAPQWFVGEGLVDIKVYTSTGALIFTALNISGTAASGQTPWPAASTGYLYFDEVSGVYSWRDAPGDHKVMVNAKDVPAYLDRKLLGNGALQWIETELEPGVWGMQAVINSAGIDGIKSITILPPSQMEVVDLSADPDNPRLLLRWTGSSDALVKADGSTIARSSLESALGAPPVDGWILASTHAGARYWRDLIASVGLSLGAAMDAIADVTNPPLTESGDIELELADQTQGKALMSPVSGTGKPAFRQIVQSDISGGPFLPLAGGTMSTANAQIQWDNQPNNGGFYGVYWQAPDCWSRVSHWGLFYAPCSNPASPRGGLELHPTVFGANMDMKSPRGEIGLSIYTHEKGGYALFKCFNGVDSVSIGSNPSGHGEIRLRDSTGHVSVVADASNGCIGCRVLSLGADLFNTTVRLTELGAGYLTSLSVTGKTEAKQGISVWDSAVEWPTGSPEVAWAHVVGKTSALVETETVGGAGKSFFLATNWRYVQGVGNVVISTNTGTEYPARAGLTRDGAFELVASLTNPVAGAVIPDFARRFSANRFGGIGAFGVTPPTTRPTVNDGATDLATVIALTNQLRTALIGCGIVQ
jgi:hypothetical protein